MTALHATDAWIDHRAITMRTAGLYSLSIGKARLQFYWPVITLRRYELHVRAGTTVRLVVDLTEERYCGVGLQILGFGFGADYYSPARTVRKAT